MAQNSGISSRKQELLSRLKNTLAIVSQATGFDRMEEDQQVVDRHNRDVDLRSGAPRVIDRRQTDVNSLDPRLSRGNATNISSQQPDDELTRWSTPHDVDLRRATRGQQWHVDSVDGEIDLYHHRTLSSPAPPVKPAERAASDKRPTSGFNKFGEIEDEDEFLYGKEEMIPKTGNPSPVVSESRWTDHMQAGYRSAPPHSASEFSSHRMASTEAPLPKQFSNYTVDSDVTHLSNVQSHSQSPFMYSRGLHHTSESSSNDRGFANGAPTQQPSFSASKRDGVSVLSNVNTDMLQNILKLVSLQKQAPQLHSVSSTSTTPVWNPDVQPTHQTTLSAQNTNTSLAPHVSVSSYGHQHNATSLSVNRDASKDVDERRSSFSQKPRSHTSDNTIVPDSRDSSNSIDYIRKVPFITKEPDFESLRPTELTSPTTVSELASATVDIKSGMTAHGSETYEKVSGQPSEPGHNLPRTSGPATMSEKSETDLKDEAFDRLFSVLGCNTDIISMMQQLIKKGDQETNKKKEILHGKMQEEFNKQIMNRVKYEIEKKEAADAARKNIEQETAEMQMSFSGITSNKPVVKLETANSEEDSKNKIATPSVTSLSHLQKNYVSDEEYNPLSPTLEEKSNPSVSGHQVDSRGQTNLTGSNEGFDKDIEWEKSTAEFLRRLQTKKPAVSREKSRSPRKVSRERPRSPHSKSKDRSPSPRVGEPKVDDLRRRDTGFRNLVSCERRCEDESKAPTKKRSLSPRIALQKPDIVRHREPYVESQPQDVQNKELSPVSSGKVVESSSVEKAGDDDQVQLLKAKEELVSTVVLLTTELEKLRVERSALLLNAETRTRNDELRKNVALQEEMGEHIFALKKALSELNSQLDQSVVTSPLALKLGDTKLKPVRKSEKDVMPQPIRQQKDAHKRRSRSSSSRSTSSSSRSSSHSSSGRRGRGGRRHRSNSRDQLRSRKEVYKSRGTHETRDKEARRDRRKTPTKHKKEARPLATVKAVKSDNQKPVTTEKVCEASKVDMERSTSASVKPLEKQNPQPVEAKSSSSVSSSVMNQPAEVPRNITSVNTERVTSSLSFTRENIINSLQQMVQSTVGEADAALVKEKDEPSIYKIKEKQTSALELAIAMYLAANQFYDGGSLWCRSCDRIFGDIPALCRHIHSDQHQLKLDPNYQTTKPSGVINRPSCNDGSFVAPSRGDEFLMPIQSFFCSLCCEYFKDSSGAEAHLKSREHNTKFKSFLKDNPTYEMQFLRGKMVAVQKEAQIQNDVPQLKSTVEQNFKSSNVVEKKEVENPPKNPDQPAVAVAETQKRKFEEVKPGTIIKRSKVSPPLKIERTILVDIGKSKGHQDTSDKDSRKVIVIGDDKEDNGAQQSLNKSAGGSDKKNFKPITDKFSGDNKNRSPDSQRNKFESRSWEKRDSSDRWKGYHGNWNDDKKWKSPQKQSVSRKESPYQQQQDKQPSSSSTSSRTIEVKDKVSASDKGVTSKDSGSKGSSTLSTSPTNIPLPSKPFAKTFEPFSLGRGSKLVKLPQKKPGTSMSSSESDRATNSAKFNLKDFEVLDECGDG